MEDFEDMESAISYAADRVVAAINNRPNYFSILMWVALGYLLFYLMPSALWHSKFRYAVQYDTKTDKVSIDKRPRDCDFLIAPLGDKNCHYEREVSTLWKKRSNTAIPTVSYDEGKTWSEFTPAPNEYVPRYFTIKEVTVGWVKKDD